MKKIIAFSIVGVVTLAASAVWPQETEITNDSEAEKPVLILAITTKVNLTEIKDIESVHLVVIKNPDEAEQEEQPEGRAATRSTTLTHETGCLDSKGLAILMPQLKKGGKVFTRAKTTIGGVTENKDKLMFTKAD